MRQRYQSYSGCCSTCEVSPTQLACATTLPPKTLLTRDSDSDDLPLLVPGSDTSDSEDRLNGPPGYSTEELVARDAPSEADQVVSTVGEEVNRSHKQTGRRSDLFVSVPHQSDAPEACPNGERPDTVEHRLLFPDVCTSYPVVSTVGEEANRSHEQT